MDFLYQIIIYPIQLFIEIIYVTLYHALENFAGRSGYAIIGVSIAVSFLTLPMYIKAEKLQDIQRDILKKMEKKLESIKRNFTGDKRYMLISAYYRENSYHPLMILRSSLSLFIMIPFFMAAYIFLSEPRLLSGESFFFLTDLSKQDQLINLFDFKINLLPILMTIINILSSYVYTEKLSKSEKFQLYITAIVFLFLLYTSPSGLVFYWTCNNIFSLFKNIWMKYNFKISSPIKFDFISKTYSKIENLKFNSTVCFILSMILFWLITGVLFPFYIISLSPLELCEVCRDMSMWKILSYPALQSFGIFIFWGILIFYLTDNKFKNILSIFSVSTFILCIINYFKNYKIGLFLFSMEFFLNDKIVPFAISFALILLFYVISILFLYKILEKYGEKIITSVLAILLIAVFINVFIYFMTINEPISRYKEITLIESKNQISNNKVFKFTKTGKNVLVIFLDMAVNSFFPIILDKDESLKKSYEGFVYYPNTAGFYCHTILGAPPIFGGYEYTPTEMNKRKGLMKDKNNESLLLLPLIFKNKGAFVSFTDAPLKNYEWISDNRLFTEKGINAYNLIGKLKYNFNETGLNIKNDINTSILLKHNFLFYSFMKIFPNTIGNIFYDNGKYLNSIFIHERKNIAIKNPNLFDSYLELFLLPKISDYSLKEDLSLNILCNDITHYPTLLQLPKYTIEKNIENVGDNFIGSDIAFSYYHVNASALYRLADYFNELKKNGVYDNTKIIIVSDHGAKIKTHASDNEMLIYLNPLLVVKDFNSKGNYKIDDSFMTVADVPYIATKDVITNPTNPFTGKNITEFDKSDGVYILAHEKNHKNYNPQDFKGEECVFTSVFKVKNKVLDIKNWKKRY